MTDNASPALTPEQWEARDYRQVARALDDWMREQGGEGKDDDRTEYVAKLGLNDRGSVVAMNRAHDRVLIPPPARAVLAAFALADQPFGFTLEDVQALDAAVGRAEDETAADALRGLAERIRALVPPAGPSAQARD